MVVESANAGMDTVFSASTYTLGANVEHLTLSGTAAMHGTGNSLANILTGNSASNTSRVELETTLSMAVLCRYAHRRSG